MAEKAVELLIDGRSVAISSPSKPYFAALGLTKLDVVDYFCSVGEGIVSALHDRPTTMERWPEGVSESAKAFFQKRAPSNTPAWVQRVSVTFPSGRTAEEVAPADLATVAWMVNLGTVRFHPWPVRVSDPDAVDQLRIDLDPQPGVSFDEAVQAALVLREVLTEAGLSGFCKTSGGRGLHVYAPIEPATFVEARHAVIAIGRELARRLPDVVTVNWWKEQRGARVFVDFNQMARDRLMTSAYSIRPTPQGRVSAPLHWDELGQVRPSDFTVATMPDRFAQYGDLWAELEATPPAPSAVALSWYARDLAAGEGEMPYPPEYPKMPGEPPRVQPSRARSTGRD